MCHQGSRLWYLIENICRTIKIIGDYEIITGNTLHLTLSLKGGQDEKELDEGLQKKRSQKWKLSRQRNLLLGQISDQRVLDNLEPYFDEFYETMEAWGKLLELCEQFGRKEDAEKLRKEIEEIERKNDEIDVMVNGLAKKRVSLVEVQEPKADRTPERKKTLRTLKKITIPIFSGRVEDYFAWRAAYNACIDSAEGSKEEKMLHLRQYLSGEPLRMIDPLGYSEDAYDAALERIHERYGGEERRYRSLMGEMNRLYPIREGNIKDMESLVSLMESLTVQLKEMDSTEDLGNGFLYQNLLKKIPAGTLNEWTKYVMQPGMAENMETFRDWMKREVRVMRRTEEILGNGMVNNRGLFRGNESRERRTDSNYRSHLTVGSDLPRQRYGTTFGMREKSEKEKGDNRQIKGNCASCKGYHSLDRCPKFQGMSVDDRITLVKKERLCFNCLRPFHQVSDCYKESTCKSRGCTTKHSYWLHKREGTTEKQNETCLVTTKVRSDPEEKRRWISLRTIPVILEVRGREIKVNALLDDASTVSYVSERVVSELGITGPQIELPVKVVGGITQRIPAQDVRMNLKDMEKKLCRRFRALALKTVTGDMRVINWRSAREGWTHLKDVIFPASSERNTVDVLIGADYLELHQSIREIKGKVNEPIARLTPLGWTCVGGSGTGLPYVHKTNFVQTFFGQEVEIEEVMKKFWEIEEVAGEGAEISKDEKRVLSSVLTDLKYEAGRYKIKLPWKEEANCLPEVGTMAENRLKCLENKFDREPGLKEEYTKIITDQEIKGYIKQVTEEEKRETKWILPHFPVIKRDSETTKVRIVFDAAAKVRGLSLNDVLETGPKLQNELFDILLRFRKNPIAIVCDIQEMYLQIEVGESDRKYLRFWWRKDGDLQMYEYRRLVFGLNTSPFLAQLVSQENAKRVTDQYPRAVDTILKSTYMDDSLDSVCTEEEGVQLQKDLAAVWGIAGMKAHKWMSNSKKVLAEIPKEDQAVGKVIAGEGERTTKTLGLHWLTESDSFEIIGKPIQLSKVTKRNLLGWIARIFDPLGLLSTYVIRGKILMQSTWLSGLGWDENLPGVIEKQASAWMDESKELHKIRIPRCLLADMHHPWTIHVFTDASKDAYGAVAYLREEMPGLTSTKIIAAKSRVAPIKITSIPRLELLGACLGLKLVKCITRALSVDRRVVTFWTDSLDVICWIRQRSKRLKPFIANRISVIQEETMTSQWRYVPTKENPADKITRGTSVRERRLVAGTKVLKIARRFLVKDCNSERERRYREKNNFCKHRRGR